MRHRIKAGSREVLAALSIAMAAGAAAQSTQPAKPAPSSQAPPNALQGFSQNRDQPVKIQSARLEVRDKDKRATFVGDVHLVQGDTTMTCKTLVVYYEQNAAAPTATNPAPAKTTATQSSAAPSGQTTSQIKKLEAIGDVVVVQKDQIASGNTGLFDMKSNTITLEGNVVMSQGPNVVRGERLLVDMTTGVSRVEPAKGGHGRVEGLFLPGSSKDQPAGPAKDVPKDTPKDASKDAGRDGSRSPLAPPMKLN